nr:hypothetical protein CFP56_32435 [Quercus suber]
MTEHMLVLFVPKFPLSYELPTAAFGTGVPSSHSPGRCRYDNVNQNRRSLHGTLAHGVHPRDLAHWREKFARHLFLASYHGPSCWAPHCTYAAQRERISFFFFYLHSTTRSTASMSTTAAADAQLPAVATPVAKLKRKRIETGVSGVVEGHDAVNGVAKPERPSSSPHSHPNARYARRLQDGPGEMADEDGNDGNDDEAEGEEEELSDDQASLFEHMLELIEEGDYVAGQQPSTRRHLDFY